MFWIFTGCGYEPQCIHSKKQTHYHCLQCGFAVLGLSQMTSHKYKHQEANLGPSTSAINWPNISVYKNGLYKHCYKDVSNITIVFLKIFKCVETNKSYTSIRNFIYNFLNNSPVHIILNKNISNISIWRSMWTKTFPCGTPEYWRQIFIVVLEIVP